MKVKHYRLHRFEFLNIMLVLILILSADLFSQLYQPTEKDWATVDVNSINGWVTDYGSIFRNPTTGNSGFEWPKGGGVHAIYAAGLWVGALVEGEARVVVAEYSYEYIPGTIDEETHLSNNPYDSTFRVYKIPNIWDYHHWPGKYGAPFTENGEPYLIGDQTLWTVYNDADSSQHVNFKSLPLGIEVQQTIFGNRMLPTTAFDFLFIRWLIINKGMNYLDSVNFSIWCDPDLGDSGDDFVGSDTILNLGYCYNSNNNDAEYGAAPPAVGFQLLQGPIVESNGDSAIFAGEKIPGFANLNMTSFIYYNGSNSNNGNPQTAGEVWNYMQSRWRNGQHMTYGGTGIDPNNSKTKYMFTGDPVNGTGWNDSFPADRRFMVSSGPINLAPGDSNEMVASVIIARDTSNLSCITELKRLALGIQSAYNSHLYKILKSYPGEPTPAPVTALKLYQNYPNPFNSQTTIKYELPINRIVRLKIYNMLGERVALLVNRRQEPGSYSITWDASGYPSGIYFVQLNVAQYQLTKKLLLIK